MFVAFFGCVLLLLAMTRHFYFLTLTFTRSCPGGGRNGGVDYDFDSLSQADMAPLCNRQHTPSAPFPPCSLLLLLYAAEQSVEGSALSAETESFSWASKLTQLLAEEALMLSSCSDERRATIIEMLPACCSCNLQPATCNGCQRHCCAARIAHTLRPLCNLPY